MDQQQLGTSNFFVISGTLQSILPDEYRKKEGALTLKQISQDYPAGESSGHLLSGRISLPSKRQDPWKQKVEPVSVNIASPIDYSLLAIDLQTIEEIKGNDHCCKLF